ncbi:hypothetical protein FACS1894132_09980 [Clostridia bacterium]|nr:hypothetical protein FACS1894132_09980 [Clostridia bacterium]
MGNDNASYNFECQNADYIIFNHINFTNAAKGLMLDNSSNCIIRYCNFSNYGEEAVHFRDGSSYNLLEYSTITNTGSKSAGYGEGIYIGSDKNKWESDSSIDTGTTMFRKECDYNVVSNCVIGGGVTAECVDIKEGTTGTRLENCIFKMGGILGVSAANYADSAIDIKGNDVVIKNCVFEDEGNALCLEAIQLHSQTEDRLWGRNAVIENNTFILTACIVAVNATHDTEAYFFDNQPSDIAVIGTIYKYAPDGYEVITTPSITTTTTSLDITTTTELDITTTTIIDTTTTSLDIITTSLDITTTSLDITTTTELDITTTTSVSITTTITHAEPTEFIGDIDGDDQIGKIADVVLLGKHVASKITLTGQSLINANTDTRDPAVNVADLQALIKFMLKQITELPYHGE